MLRPPTLALTLVCGTLVAGLSGVAGVAGPAQAAARPQSAASTSSRSVTVLLKAPHPERLARLAATPASGRSQRLRELARVVPGAAQHRAVVDALRAQGLKVTNQSAWSVTATAPADLVTSTFGSRADALGPRTGLGPLPAVPSSLAPLVSAVYPTRGGPAAFHHSTGQLTGGDVRRADTPARVKPSSGTHDGKLTIATVQLADFDSGDLSAYARSHHLPDPVANGRFRRITVDGGPVGGGVLGDGGAVEVDLDQESILSTAPSAKQHAYFAPNTEAGFADAFSAAYDDVVGNKHAHLPDPHIGALSVSWGACESLTGPHQIGVFEPILESLVAAGVTVFASAGDAGIYDCGSSSGSGTDNHQADVDFPASSPAVVAVGGTRLHAAASKPYNGHNWNETVWSCTGPVACQNQTSGTGGGGGGASGSGFHHGGKFRGFAQPAYQTATLGSRYGHAGRRLLPDISGDADPRTGFEIYTSDLTTMLLFGGHTGTVGGTSLAAPLSAAQLVNTLGDAHRSTGVGDIHGALYSAYTDTQKLPATSSKRPFRDVVHGQIGAEGDRGARNPSTHATRGYDTASGLGGVLWSALKPYLLTTAKPALTASLHRSGGAVVARWSARAGRDPLVLAGTRAVLVDPAHPQHVLAHVSGNRRTVRHGFAGHRRLRLVVVTADIGGHAVRRSLTVHR